MNKQTHPLFRAWISWGFTALSQVLNDNGHEVRIWEIFWPNWRNQYTTYQQTLFRDTVLDEKDLRLPTMICKKSWRSADAVLFVVPTSRLTRLVAQQVAAVLWSQSGYYACKISEPNSHQKRLSGHSWRNHRLRSRNCGCIWVPVRKTIVRDITAAAS